MAVGLAQGRDGAIQRKGGFGRAHAHCVNARDDYQHDFPHPLWSVWRDYALALSRDSLEATANAARSMAIGLALGGAYVVLGAMLVLDDPMLRFIWVVATLFLVFYVMSALSNYGAAARFGYLIVITIPLWDGQIPTGQKVEGTLWAVGAITIANVIPFLLEIVFAAFRPSDALAEAITERLATTEELLADYADHRSVEAATQSAITRLATVGTSRLRRILQPRRLRAADRRCGGARRQAGGSRS